MIIHKECLQDNECLIESFLSTLEGEEKEKEGIFRIYLQLSRIDSSIVLTDSSLSFLLR